MRDYDQVIMPTVASPDALLDQPRLLLAPRGRLLGGVSAGIATHIAVPTWAVRVAFAVLVPLQGVGVLLYAVFWVILPAAPCSDQRRRRGRGIGHVLVFGVMVAVTISILSLWHSSTQILVLGCLGGVVIGGALTFQQADASMREQSISVASPLPWSGVGLARTPTTLLRWACGGGLVLAGLAGLLIVAGELTALRSGLIFTAAMLIGVVVVLGPWLARVLGSLRQERYERIRSQERAEVAAVVHDKMMHTLALIQRRAGDAREVSRLARGQERELRTWLYKPASAPDQQLSAAMEAAAAEVEDSYAVTVDVVVVGDAVLDPALAALVAATREALLNAAKHAGVANISLYVEAEPAIEHPVVSVFVRDRGSGFALDAIPPDRHGVHDSIMARMRRHSGQAELRTAPEEGTEVRLRMPLSTSGQPYGGGHDDPATR